MIDLGQVTSMGQLLEAARTAERQFSDNQLWFRGHSDAGWHLVPSAHRIDPVLESQMLHHFRLRAPAFYSGCPNHSDYPSWLPLMRHYGLPTRLLDWTESLAVAAFFATQQPRMSGTARVLMLSPGDLNRQSIGQIVPFLSNERVLPIVDAAFGAGRGDPNIIAVFAPRRDPRMAAQICNFTIHGTRDALDSHSGSDQFLASVTIPDSAQTQFNLDLSLLGVRLSNLFPDLQHLAAEIASLVAIVPNDEPAEAARNSVTT